MIVINNGEKLYCSNWQYNACRIITELAKIVENHDGRVKAHPTALIHHRGLRQKKMELEHHLDIVKKRIERDPDPKAIEHYEKKMAELNMLKGISEEPLQVTHTTYISFVLDNIYYYYQLDDNPFFPFYYMKTPVENGCYHIDAYMVADKKEWEDECFYRMDCSQADIVEGANLIFNMLLKADCAHIGRHASACRSNRWRKIEF
jgi:hypothetical protein